MLSCSRLKMLMRTQGSCSSFSRHANPSSCRPAEPTTATDQRMGPSPSQPFVSSSSSPLPPGTSSSIPTPASNAALKSQNDSPSLAENAAGWSDLKPQNSFGRWREEDGRQVELITDLIPSMAPPGEPYEAKFSEARWQAEGKAAVTRSTPSPSL